MNKFIVFGALLIGFNAHAASTHELLVQNLTKNRTNYTCSFNELNGEAGREIVVCVKGENLRSIELIDFWVSNYTYGSSTKEEHEKFMKRAEYIIPDSTFVVSVKDIDKSNPNKSFTYMSFFCDTCQDIDSATLIKDRSAFVFDSLKSLSPSD
ncbi:hypothetical protein ACSTLM_04550 [Vibrio parahaemolyticus]